MLRLSWLMMILLLSWSTSAENFEELLKRPAIDADIMLLQERTRVSQEPALTPCDGDCEKGSGKVNSVRASAAVLTKTTDAQVDESLEAVSLHLHSHLMKDGKVEEEAGDCDNKALDKARSVFDSFSPAGLPELSENPCVAKQFMDGIEQGLEDPADSWEFLGRVVEDEENQKTLLPKLLFIGLAHSGSTSLANEMEMHPQLSYGKMKEHNYLDLLSGSSGQFREKYQNQFPVDENVTYTFDATPHTMFLGLEGDKWYVKAPIGRTYGTGIEGVKAIKDVLGGDVKFITMLRDPLDWQTSMSTQPLDQKLGTFDGEKPHASLLAERSCYVDALETWMDVFPKGNFLFLESTEFFSDPQDTLNQVFDFIGVHRIQYEKDELEPQGRRRSGRHATTTAGERSTYWADDRQKECLQRLEKLSGRNFKWGAR